MISAVAFDIFGTIVRISQRTNPYGQLIREGRRQGVAATRESTHFVMTANLSLEETAASLGISLSPSKRIELSDALERELSSIVTYPDAVRAVAQLQDAGVIVGLCSNLAQPFGRVVKELFPSVIFHAFSYEVGVTKPNPVIYHSMCKSMGVESGHLLGAGARSVLMIGDSKKCDQNGPRTIGMMGFHLDRAGQGPIRDLAQFAQLIIDKNL